jgi:AcrR family transcriptional regulator
MIRTAGKDRAGRIPAPARRGRRSLDQVLIEAAMDLFASYGYRGTSLSRIAKAAGVTKGALYWHFTDKEDFFLAVVDKVLAEWNKPAKAKPPADSPRGFEREFLWTFENMARLNEQNPWVSRLLLIITLESHKRSPRMLRAIRKANQRHLNGFAQLIERGRKLGVFNPELDAEWAATQIFASYLGLANLWYLHGPRFDLRRSLTRAAHEFLGNWRAAR